MKELLDAYKLTKNKITSRLNDFKVLSEENQFKEMLFCILTPQSNAQRCWQAVEQLSKLQKLENPQVLNILKTKTRFHNTKSNRIIKVEETWKIIKPLLNNPNRLELRDKISEIVNGYGLKEASHFLRNIGKSDNQIAILDRHILRNLKKYEIISEEKIKSKKQYKEIESLFLNFSKQNNIPADHLDLLWWSQENGEIFK